MKVFILVYGHENHFWSAFILKALANTDRTKARSSALVTCFPTVFLLKSLRVSDMIQVFVKGKLVYTHSRAELQAAQTR